MIQKTSEFLIVLDKFKECQIKIEKNVLYNTK